MGTQKETPGAGTPGEYVNKAKDIVEKVNRRLGDVYSALKEVDSAARAATDALRGFGCRNGKG